MTLEREVKLDVAPDFTMPSLADQQHCITATAAGTHLLDATYWDTAGLSLLRAGYGLRRRTTDGGAATWTLKGESSVDGDALVRDEIDINSDNPAPPDELRKHLPSQVDIGVLEPVVRITTQRTLTDLIDETGTPWAEVADDRVTVHAADGRSVATFREVEVELKGPADGSRLEETLRRLRGSGAVSPQIGAKYLKALAALGRELP